MKINSIDKDIKGILGSCYYQIPRFQRPYSWEREHIEDFWNDTIQDSEADYFIGSMVVFKKGMDTYGIVDGQQRLTTITMILCALRNALQKEGFPHLAQGIHQLIERPNIDNEPQFILTTESSFPYFQEHIQKFGKPEIEEQVGDEEKNIESAFSQIIANIEGAINAIKSDTTINEDTKREKVKQQLLWIRERVLGLKVIFVELDNDDDAYIIFETMNTRGKDLSVSDLVKAHLTRLLRPKNVAVDTPRIKWEKIVETIEGSGTDMDTKVFLHHYWLSKHDYVTMQKLFKHIKKLVKKNNAQAFIDELESEAVTYREIHETSFKKWRPEEKTIRDALEAFSLFRIKQQVPIILSVMRDYKAGNLKKADVEQILKAIENFHFIFTAVTSQRSSGGISHMYASSARGLVAEVTLEKKRRILNELQAKFPEKIPVYQEFEANFKEICYTNKYTKQRNLVKYILSRVHAYQNPGVIADYNNMTVEHVLPQSAGGTAGISEAVVGQLGNMILIPHKLNNRLGERSFLQKRQLLSKSNVYLDDIIKKASTWGPSQIEERTKYLANLCYNTIWKV